jgi:hypothetical protein
MEPPMNLTDRDKQIIKKDAIDRGEPFQLQYRRRLFLSLYLAMSCGCLAVVLHLF